MKLLQNKRIFLLTSALNGGGAERVFCWLALQLERLGARVTVFSLSGEPPSDLSFRDIHILEWRSERDYPAVIWKLSREIRQTQPDLVVGWSFLSNLAVILAVRLSGRSMRTVCNERSRVSELLKSSGWMKRTLLRFLTRWCYRRANRVLCNSRAAKDDLIDRFGIPAERLGVVPNPVDVERIQKLQTSYPPEFEGAVHPIYLQVARLSQEKGADDALEAWYALPEDQRGTLFFIGDGPERPRLEARIKKRQLEGQVRLIGYRKEPYGYMYHCDVMLLCSQYEGFPNVVLEGLAAGAVVVATESCDNVIELGKAGCCLTCPPKDQQALTTQMLNATQPTVRQELRRQSRIGIQQFSSPRVLEEYVQQFLSF